MQHPATRVHMLEVGSLVGEYRIEKLVGQGGMGQVYGAIHPVIGKRAAIKVLRGELCSDPETIQRFVLEARAVNQIGHPNIVDVFAFGALPDGRQYMVMEWLRGESLDQRIRRMLPTLDETCEIALSVCAALDAAHAEQIVHRDLKPHNVFLAHARGMKPTVKLLDFGLVKLMGDDGRMDRTRSGSMLGTPAYMSPEQARGRGVDYRTDLYALGVMLFELVTGTLPFVEQSAMEMVMAHLQAAPPVPSSYRPGIPPMLDQLILGLLAKQPEQRPSLAATVHVLTEVGKLAAAAPQALTPTLIASHPPRVAAPPALPGGADLLGTVTSTPASVPMLVPSVAEAPAQLATGSVPATGVPLAAASVAPMAGAHPASTTAPSSSPAAGGGRRVLLAVLAALAVAGIAFGVVMAARHGDAPASAPDAMSAAPPVPDAVATTPPVDAAAVAPVPDAPAVTAPVDAVAAEPAHVDAAIAPPVDATRPGRGRPRDAGVARPATADAGVAAPPADAAKPFDDGDGLLPTRGGSR